MIYLILLPLFIIAMLLYFCIADHYNIIDKPNERSSHNEVTIRGGGIIFPVAAIIFFIINGLQYPFFITGLLAISLISFLDDLLTLNNKLRLAVHLIAVALLFCQWNLFVMPWYWLIMVFVFIIGTLNAYNFMDGINGITGAYSLVAIATLYYINEYMIVFTEKELLLVTGLALLVFNFFNFRIKAKCFAGDIGSVSIAFILIFLIGQLIIHTGNITYILFLLLYGLDTVTTIISRLIKRENIFKAHRSHYFQYLVNERNVPHLIVSAGYAIVQLLFNIILIRLLPVSVTVVIIFTILASCLFIGIRFGTEGKARLLGQQV